MTFSFIDKFNVPDQFDLDPTTYLVPCGRVGIFDEAVLPIAPSGTGESPFGPGVSEKTQVFYQATTIENPDYVTRGVWGHDDVVPANVNTPPSFTILVRMSKDPLILDLGGSEEPECFDQGYGLRVTCPLDGSAPVAKLVKFVTDKRAPGLGRLPSTEPDGAIVLTSVTLKVSDLNVDPEVVIDPTVSPPAPPVYRGFWQDMRLRIRRGDAEVVLEGYLNDRHLNTPVISFTDRQDPLWSAVGLTGFEFLSAVRDNQPAEASPFDQSALGLMRCTLFSLDVIKDFSRPQIVTPQNFFTYNRIVSRVITLVEKNGDAKFTATLAGQTKFDTYLDFVHEAEMAIARKEGYWWWLRQESNISLREDEENYELPENCAEVELLRPTWSSPPLEELQAFEFYRRLAGVTRTGGRPALFTFVGEGVNNRRRIRVFPIPTADTGANATSSSDPAPTPEQQAQQDQEAADDFLIVTYYARPILPTEPDMQLPLIPQHHIDVLTYAATAHALLLDTDPQNAQFYLQAASAKLKDLRRENNRRMGTTQTIMRSAADVFIAGTNSRIPLLRATQLETFLI